MRIVLLGKDGQVGSSLNLALRKFGDIFAYGSSDLDLREASKIIKILRDVHPHIIINAAAYTNVDQAEVEPKLAMQVNAVAPKIIAEVSKSINALFIHFSTNYVFDGSSVRPYKEDDLPNPINVYGKSKIAGENAIQSANCVFLILRTSWVYDMQGDNFLTRILSLYRQSHKIRVVSDQIGSPTWTETLTESVVKIILLYEINHSSDFRKYAGVYNIADLGTVSRLDWARAIIQNDLGRKSKDCDIIQPSLSSDFSSLAQRPLFSALDCNKIQKTFGVILQNWETRLNLAMTNHL